MLSHTRLALARLRPAITASLPRAMCSATGRDGGGSPVRTFQIQHHQATKAFPAIEPIMADTTTKIYMTQADGDMRDVKIVGESMESVDAAHKMFMSHIENAQDSGETQPRQQSQQDGPRYQRDGVRREGRGAGQPGGAGGDDVMQEAVDVKAEVVSMVIGKGGTMIKHIQQTTGAGIYVEQMVSDPERQKTRKLVIKGPTESREAAKKLVMEIVDRHAQSKLSGGSEQEVFMVPNRAVSAIIGRGGSSIQHIKSTSGAMILIENREMAAEGSEREVKVRGTKEQIAVARSLIDAKMAESAQAELDYAAQRESSGMGQGRPRQQRSKSMFERVDAGGEEMAEGEASGIISAQEDDKPRRPVPAWKLALERGEKVEKPPAVTKGLVDVDILADELANEPDQMTMSEETRKEIESMAQVLKLNPGMAPGEKVMLLKGLARLMEKPIPEHLLDI